MSYLIGLVFLSFAACSSSILYPFSPSNNRKRCRAASHLLFYHWIQLRCCTYFCFILLSYFVFSLNFFIYTIYSKLALLYENILCLVPRKFVWVIWMVYYVTFSVHFLYHFSVIKGFSERFEQKFFFLLSSWQCEALTHGFVFRKMVIFMLLFFVPSHFMWQERRHFNCSWRVLFHYHVSDRPTNFRIIHCHWIYCCTSNELAKDLISLKKMFFSCFYFNIFFFFFFCLNSVWRNSFNFHCIFADFFYSLSLIST